MGKINKKPTDFKQGDSRWGKIRYATKGETSTIHSAGCCPTSCADIANKFVSSKITPKEVAAWMLSHGYKVLHSGTSYDAPKAYFKTLGIDCTRLTSSSIYGNPSSKHIKTALKALDDGDYVIACMGPNLYTKSGHYICCYGYDASYIYVCDPASSASYRLKGNINTWKKQVKQLVVVHIADYLKKKQEEEKKDILIPTETNADYNRFVSTLKEYYNKAYSLKLGETGKYTKALNEAIGDHNITEKSPDKLIEHMQYWLKHEGYTGLKKTELEVDGDWGKNTEYAVLAMQKKLGLKADGVIGTDTIKEFLKELNK